MEANKEFEIDTESMNLEIDFNVDFGKSLEIDSRVHRPAYHKPFKPKHVKYKNAEDLAGNLGVIGKDEKAYCLLSGAFIFGDFIEAYVVKHNLHIKRLLVSTLSMSQENVDSLKNLTEWEYVDRLDLLVSSYFWSHERWKLVPYILQKLDGDHNKFQLSVSANHCKVVLFETHDGNHFVMHGSANLRSANCIEQLCIENNKEFYDFNMEFFGTISDKFQTIDKEVKHNRGSKLWQRMVQT